MRKILLAACLFCSTILFACPDCNGQCDQSSKIPKVMMAGDLMIFTELCKDLYEGREAFIQNLIDFGTIESKEDVLTCTPEMIVVKTKKK